jgi:bacterioferritin-associated ferredoxin
VIVCVCRRVSDKVIALHASEGKGFEDIQFDLGVATQCGRCEECARNIVEQCHATSAIAPAGWMPVSLSMGR